MSVLSIRIQAAREFWVDLGDGLKVKVRMPPRTRVHAFWASVTDESLLASVVDWQGFSEATFLTPAVGSSDLLPWDAEAWLAGALDHPEWINQVSVELLDRTKSLVESAESTAKN